MRPEITPLIDRRNDDQPAPDTTLPRRETRADHRTPRFQSMRPRRSAVLRQRRQQRLVIQNIFRNDVRSAAPPGDDAPGERDRPAGRRDLASSVSLKNAVNRHRIAALIVESAAGRYAAIAGERAIHDENVALLVMHRSPRTSCHRIGRKRAVREQQTALPVEERSTPFIAARPVEI